jgi:hypothetical protein
VVAPTIFDVALAPGLLHTLVLANAASPRLWRLRDRLLSRAQEPALQDPLASLQLLQTGLNRLFTHTSPLEVMEANGSLDLEEQAARLGREAVEEVLEASLRSVRSQLQTGLLDPARYALEPLIEAGRFPAYTYATVDGIIANGRLPGRPNRRPQGITSCLDEVALFAALLLISPQALPDGIAVLASPAHYTLFGWYGPQSWWFYGKNQLLLSADPCVLEQRLGGLSMLVTRRGTWQQRSGGSSIPAEELQQLCERLQTFFGGLPPALAPGSRQAIRHVDPSPMDQLFARVLQCDGPEAVLACLRAEAMGSGECRAAAREVLSCWRDLNGADPVTLLEAARQGPRLRQLQAGLGSLDEAIRQVGAIRRSDSIFENRDRLALPEETLKFDTGTDRDRSLLLQTLLEPLYGVGAVSTLLEPQRSLVCCPDGVFCTTTMRWVDPADFHRPAAGADLLMVSL